MKKTVKKLILAKETVLNLEAGDLKQIAGGWSRDWGATCDNLTACQVYDTR